MPKSTTKKRAPRTKSKADIARTIELMAEQYGPFSEEPRLPPMDEMVFTILSQHTSDINSSRAFRLLMEKFGTLESVAAGDIQDIEKAIAPGGLAKIKAPRIKEVLNKVLELNEGSLDLSFLREMPLQEAKAWLRQLPGIGPKSAGIVLSFSLGMPAMAIDTHIYRVSQRLGVIGPKVSADKAHDILEEKVEPGEVFNFHVSYINHGRQVCRAQRPKCPECVVGDLCPSRKKFMTKKELAELAASEEQTLAGSSGAPMPHVPQTQESLN
ncbi:MAG TPA: DNA lyase [Dehalococcoidia bacterium]|nr:DNA lyase [Chloroflexota bacterium]HCL25104.1 DNA lyase [Dehalococcoidia bacterium]